MFWKVVLLLCLIWYLVNCWKNRALIKLYEKLKCDHIPVPFLGHSYLLRGNGEKRMKALQKLGLETTEKGGLMAVWHAQSLIIMITDPEIADIVLKSCLEKHEIMKYSRIFTGNGSIFAPVNIWRQRRKAIAPTFSLKNLNQFLKVFNNQSLTMVERLRGEAGAGTFSLWSYISSYTLDSICETALGTATHAQSNSHHPFIRAFEIISKLGSARLCKPWLQNKLVYHAIPYFPTYSKNAEILYNFVDKVIEQKRNEINTDNSAKNKNVSDDGTLKTFLELFIESTGNENGFTNVELREEILVITLAGTDTSAVGVSFITLMLAKYPDVQEKVYQEIIEIFGRPMRHVQLEDLNRLKYLEAVIKETLRLYPPVPIIAREVERDLELPNGITLVKNCGPLINIWAIHRNQKYWGEDADLFKPERFLDGGGPSHPAAYMPFSQGPRSCLGYRYAMMSMKTALANLLHCYRILPSSDTVAMGATNQGQYAQDEKSNPLRVSFSLMMKDVNRFCVELERRI